MQLFFMQTKFSHMNYLLHVGFCYFFNDLFMLHNWLA